MRGQDWRPRADRTLLKGSWNTETWLDCSVSKDSLLFIVRTIFNLREETEKETKIHRWLNQPTNWNHESYRPIPRDYLLLEKAFGSWSSEMLRTFYVLVRTYSDPKPNFEIHQCDGSDSFTNISTRYPLASTTSNGRTAAFLLYSWNFDIFLVEDCVWVCEKLPHVRFVLVWPVARDVELFS